MELKGSFKAMDFINEYKNGSLKWDGIFHRNNTKRYIDTYIEYHKKNIEYKKSEKTWHVVYGENDNVDKKEVDINKLPFPID